MFNITLPFFQYKEIITTIADITVLVMAAFTITFFKQIKQWLIERKSKSFDLAINRNSVINALLSELRALYRTDRVMFFQIHNGEYFLSGESNMKCSMTHFVVRTGVAMPIGSLYQNVPTTHLVSLFAELKDKNVSWFEVDSETEAKHDPTLRHLLALTGTRWALICPVKKYNNIWMGFVVLSWMDDLGKPKEIELEKYAQQIADVLNIPKK